MKCPECGEECDTTTIDMGVGYSEYQGVVQIDIVPVAVTRCCWYPIEEIPENEHVYGIFPRS